MGAPFWSAAAFAAGSLLATVPFASHRRGGWAIPPKTGLEVHVLERSTRSALEAQAGRLGLGLGGGDDDARDVHELADVRAVQRPDRRRGLVRDEVHLDLELVEHVLGTADARDERILLRVEPSLVAKGLHHGNRGVLQAGYVNVRLVADLLGELRVVRCGWVSGIGTLVGGAGLSGGARRGTGGRARSGHERWEATMGANGFERGRVDDSRVRRRIARTRAMRVLPRANRSPMMSSRSTVTSRGGVSWSSLSRYTRRPSGYSAVGSLLKFLRNGKLPPRLPRGHALAVPPRAPVAVAQVRVVHVFVPSRHRRDG